RHPTRSSRRCRTRESVRQRSSPAQGTPYWRTSRYLSASSSWFPPLATTWAYVAAASASFSPLLNSEFDERLTRASERSLDQRTNRLTRWRNPHQLQCPLLAQSRHARVHRKCPLSGVRRTWTGAVQMSALTQSGHSPSLTAVSRSDMLGVLA